MEGWLAQDVVVEGVHFQNWMPIAAAIVLAAIGYALLQRRRRQ
jgi:hypothetical protein